MEGISVNLLINWPFTFFAAKNNPKFDQNFGLFLAAKNVKGQNYFQKCKFMKKKYSNTKSVLKHKYLHLSPLYLLPSPLHKSYLSPLTVEPPQKLNFTKKVTIWLCQLML